MSRVIKALQPQPLPWKCARAMEAAPLFLGSLAAFNARRDIRKEMNRVRGLLRINGAYATDELFDQELGAPRFYKALRDRLKELKLELELAGAKHQQAEAAFEKALEDFDKAFPAPQPSV